MEVVIIVDDDDDGGGDDVDDDGGDDHDDHHHDDVDDDDNEDDNDDYEGDSFVRKILYLYTWELLWEPTTIGTEGAPGKKVNESLSNRLYPADWWKAGRD